METIPTEQRIPIQCSCMGLPNYVREERSRMRALWVLRLPGKKRKWSFWLVQRAGTMRSSWGKWGGYPGEKEAQSLLSASTRKEVVAMWGQSLFTGNKKRSPRVVPFTERTLKHWMPNKWLSLHPWRYFRHVDMAFREVV